MSSASQPRSSKSATTQRIDSLLLWSLRVAGLAVLAIVALLVVVFAIAFFVGLIG